MLRPGYEYRDLMATTWDLFRGDTSHWPDRAFYREIIARYGQPALDVGCATGAGRPLTWQTSWSTRKRFTS